MGRVITLLVVLLVGCEPASSSVLVELRTDFVPGVEFDAFVLASVSGPGLTRAVSVDEDGADWTSPQRMGELAIEAGAQAMSVRLTRAGMTVIERDLTVVVEGRTGLQVLFTRDCAGVTCGAGEACIAGQCVTDRCLSGTEPECDFVPECTLDGDCVDANMCAPLVCEPPGYCFPDRFDCPPGQYCDITSGCTPIPPRPDGGIPGGDGGMPPDGGVRFEVPEGIPLANERSWIRTLITEGLRVPRIDSLDDGFGVAMEGSRDVLIAGPAGEDWNVSISGTPVHVGMTFDDPESPGMLRNQFFAALTDPLGDELAFDCLGDRCAWATHDEASQTVTYGYHGPLSTGENQGAQPGSLALHDVVMLESDPTSARVGVSAAPMLPDPSLSAIFRDTGLGGARVGAFEFGDEAHAWLAADGGTLLALTKFRAPLRSTGTLVVPPSYRDTDDGLLLYVEAIDTTNVITGDFAGLEILAFTDTGDPERPSALLAWTADEITFTTPTGSSIPEAVVPARSHLVLEFRPDGTVSAIIPFTPAFPSGDVNERALRADLQLGLPALAPHYRIALVANEHPNELLLGRLGMDGTFTIDGFLAAEEIADFAVRDERDVYVITRGTWVYLPDQLREFGSVAGFIVRYSVASPSF